MRSRFLSPSFPFPIRIAINLLLVELARNVLRAASYTDSYIDLKISEKELIEAADGKGDTIPFRGYDIASREKGIEIELPFDRIRKMIDS